VTLHDGRRAVMKIQYPGVARSIESDVDNLMRLISVANLLPKGLYVENAGKWAGNGGGVVLGVAAVSAGAKPVCREGASGSRRQCLTQQPPERFISQCGYLAPLTSCLSCSSLPPCSQGC
jgi:hypothetical protein